MVGVRDMTSSKDNKELTQESSVAKTYSRFPVTLVKGRGVKVWDDRGREYTDFAAGIAVCGLGHCHPGVTEAIARQAAELVHVSNLYWNRPQCDLARMLAEHSFADRVFFCNSGAESVEAAIKLARRFGHDTKGPDCFEIICLRDSFHGRTLATLTATGQRVFQRGFDPLPPGFTHVPPNDVDSLKLAVSPRTAAVLVEPIQGEGGVRLLSDEFLAAARKICDDAGALLIFDEVQVGMGRTGTLFAYEQTPVAPDVMCLAKALGNGVPIGAMLAKEEIMAHLTPGSHASTFGGNPLACAAALTVLETMTAPGFLEGVREKGRRLSRALEGLAADYPELIKEVRGRGLIQAIETREPYPDLVRRLMDRGFLALLSREKILRLVPPLIIENRHIDALIQTLSDIFKQGRK